MNVFNKQIVVNQAVNATVNSPAIPVVNTYGYAVQAVYTGTINGTIKLQASVDAFKYVNDNQPQVPTNWDDIANSSFVLSSAGVTVWNVTGAFYTFFRVVFTDASGGTSTGHLTINANAKGV